MSAIQSNLSNAKYGYDFVVATTQESINNAMEMYLSNLTQPVVKIVYIADPHGNPTRIDYNQLLSATGGIDPFSIPATANPATDAGLRALRNARFMVGFDVQLGLPGGVNFPDIITLGNSASSVIFKMICAEFRIVELTVGGYSGDSWTNVQQPATAPWIFTSQVNLQLSTVAPASLGALPTAVRNQMLSLGPNTFSVQQLLFDLTNAALESIPTISNFSAGTTVYNCLQQDFLGKYFETCKANGEPLLGFTITQTNTASQSSLAITDFAIEVCPYLDLSGMPIVNPTINQEQIATLNYLCTTQNSKPQPPVEFNWNWIDLAARYQFDGVVAINRNTYAGYLQTQLYNYVSSNCYVPTVQLPLNHLAQVEYNYNLTPGANPVITSQNTGACVFTFSYSATSYDQAGLHGDLGKMSLTPSFSLTAIFSGNTITIIQSLIIATRISVLATTDGGNIVDKTITDIYTLGVTSTGQLSVSKKSIPQDNSRVPGVNGFLNFFTKFNSLAAHVATWANGVVATNFTDIPIASLQNFVFPGGNTFSFCDVMFSANQDLTAHITFADPS